MQGAPGQKMPEVLPTPLEERVARIEEELAKHRARAAIREKILREVAGLAANTFEQKKRITALLGELDG